MQSLLANIGELSPIEISGRVQSVQGLLVEIVGPIHAMSVGARVSIEGRGGRQVPCEIIGFRSNTALAMPFGNIDGVRMGAPAKLVDEAVCVHPAADWLGRVVNALGEPIDGKGPLSTGPQKYLLKNNPPPAHTRNRVGPPVDLGVRALNSFTTCCEGQRMGIFAGTGVGKSVLLSMLARNTSCDVAVIGLIGERGREVQEFIHETLGEEGLKRSIIIVATSDEAALMRRQAAYLTLTMAEYFRDQGSQVLCMIDSVTRFAMAQREIGLSAGEPPTTKGYTPTVFAELPKLLERAGPGTGAGAITGLFTVLVDGDDHNEPIADAVRGILDGHIVMDRAIAERGRYPAINILRSLSRTMPDCVDPEHRPFIAEARRLMATYADMEELIRIGAYRTGSSAEVDEAIHYHPKLEAFLAQEKDDNTSISQSFEMLAQLLNSEPQLTDE